MSPTRQSLPARTDRAIRSGNQSNRSRQATSFAERREFLFARPFGSAWNRTRAGFLSLLLELARGKHDADRLLHALEDAGRHVRLMAFRRAIDHPDLGTGAPQISRASSRSPGH